MKWEKNKHNQTGRRNTQTKAGDKLRITEAVAKKATYYSKEVFRESVMASLPEDDYVEMRSCPTAGRHGDPIRNKAVASSH